MSLHMTAQGMLRLAVLSPAVNKDSIAEVIWLCCAARVNSMLDRLEYGLTQNITILYQIYLLTISLTFVYFLMTLTYPG